LLYIEECLKTYEHLDKWESRLEKLALERLAQVLIESVIDVGNQMIDGFIMRDPGSYADIMDILCDEKVLPDEEAGQLKEFIAERKALVRSYDSVSHDRLAGMMSKSLEALKRFPDRVRDYIKEELGPVSAFLPERD
jgi:uncharacterized protein YutE (UPF0331/DUF86 family)